MFTQIKIDDPSIELPEGYLSMFCDMESLKSFIIGRMAHEAEQSIRNQVSKQMKDLDFYESKGI